MPALRDSYGHGSSFLFQTQVKDEKMKVTSPPYNSGNSVTPPGEPKGPQGPKKVFEEYFDDALEHVNADLRSLHFRVLELEKNMKLIQIKPRT